MALHWVVVPILNSLFDQADFSQPFQQKFHRCAIFVFLGVLL